MTLVQYGFAAAVALGVLSAVAAVLVPDGARSTVAGVGTALAGAAGVAAGGAALSGQTFSLALPAILPLSGVSFTLDALGGLFVAVTGGVAVVTGIYGISYTRHGLDSRGVQAAFPVFVVAMLLVPAAASVGTFLVCWELMALASLLLVLAEHRRRPEVASAGRWYAVMTHLGLLSVLIGLLLAVANTADDGFATLRAAHLPAGTANVVFVVTLAGFASKAGILPLHAWLPRAHPEAPSHVSALMSAAMVNLGVYGIVRVGFDLLGGGPRWWWLLVLALGAVSAVYGILQAAMGTDLKRLLGYSTTENMGLVLTGIGAAGLFASSGRRDLAGLALAAALLHVAGHAAFKTLLFLGAGSVVHGTGTRDLDALGGLRARMPVTTALFGWGALAASALPPGTAFVSEWLLLQALIHGLPAAGVATAVAMPLAVAAVALTAGLAVATFVKAFGVGFLARPRSAAAGKAHESPPSMLAGMGLAALVCAVLAVLPGLVLPAIGRVAANVTGAADPVVAEAVTVRLAGVAGALSPLMLTLALLGAAIVAVAGVRLVAVRRARRAARLWDCGGGPMSARMEYTATSFAEPLQRVFDDVVRPETDVDVTHHEESDYLVRAVAYRTRVPDRVERRLYEPVLAAVRAWGSAGRRLANGSVHRYLGYGFSTLCGLLLLLAVTR
ncbi:formate hydrogenlyase subunit 3/multisubunit Na+/H+ antiporter MnhD subunit [Amycolatopsis lexingtonensis]|uniref:Formate hydrogenlyase subunit 3/multisubunit Na+/H+ antiporter MnhD subunit n=2 Tax=Amycolatopsis lexingtonensis TaxID=218822 RepID=A0ABR9HY73_9PSEU|nr:proton-conducting transporter membrane subunit [Amycolatopsis lexingtonensis]MBE1495884.1 formate hydrogenlyase subunit 3/multisubunit Na+/H+ antiporter MnhD subunit [Amycolatopsis lexingtonensis]